MAVPPGPILYSVLRSGSIFYSEEDPACVEILCQVGPCVWMALVIESVLSISDRPVPSYRG